MTIKLKNIYGRMKLGMMLE